MASSGKMTRSAPLRLPSRANRTMRSTLPEKSPTVVLIWARAMRMRSAQNQRLIIAGTEEKEGSRDGRDRAEIYKPVWFQQRDGLAASEGPSNPWRRGTESNRRIKVLQA